MLSNEQSQQQQTNLISALLNFLQQQRLLSVLRIVRDRKSQYFQLKLRNTTNAMNELYFQCQYALCMSHPLAVILKASTQCLRNEKEDLACVNGMWTQNSHSWLGNDVHSNTYTLRSNVKPHKKLAAVVVDRVCQRLSIGGRNKITNSIFRNRLECVEAFLRDCVSARAEDFTFTFVPLHRNKMQKIELKTAEMTYVELFRHLEELGYGSLYITPDQTSLTFTMHDLKDSNLFAVELPTSIFSHYNKTTGSFFTPQVRVDQWTHDDKQFTRKYNVPLENGFSTLELSYADDEENHNALSGITTVALEKELCKDLQNESEIPNAQTWVNTVYTEIKKLEKSIKDATTPFLHGRSPANSPIMTKNENFLLTSKMRLTMALDLEYQTTYAASKVTNPAVYSPHDYTLYDVKLPYSPDTITVTSYTRSLDMGRYDIKKDTTTFSDAYTSYNTITAPKGFYTPLSLIRHLQTECDKYQYPCTFSLVNKNVDDNDQGFLRIENSKEIYLQFNPIAQELFRLPVSFLSPSSSFTTDKPFDLQPDSFTNIIYCDIVGESVVGSQREKILCISPVQHSDYRYGQWAGKEFASADYYPLAMKTVQQIEIQLRGDTGDYIPITQGRTYMKLHFRRKAT